VLLKVELKNLGGWRGGAGLGGCISCLGAARIPTESSQAGLAATQQPHGELDQSLHGEQPLARNVRPRLHGDVVSTQLIEQRLLSTLWMTVLRAGIFCTGQGTHCLCYLLLPLLRPPVPLPSPPRVHTPPPSSGISRIGVDSSASSLPRRQRWNGGFIHSTTRVQGASLLQLVVNCREKTAMGSSMLGVPCLNTHDRVWERGSKSGTGGRDLLRRSIYPL